MFLRCRLVSKCISGAIYTPHLTRVSTTAEDLRSKTGQLQSLPPALSAIPFPWQSHALPYTAFSCRVKHFIQNSFWICCDTQNGRYIFSPLRYYLSLKDNALWASSLNCCLQICTNIIFVLFTQDVEMTRYTRLRSTPSYASEKKPQTLLWKIIFHCQITKGWRVYIPRMYVSEVLCFVCKEVFLKQMGIFHLPY